MRKDETTMQDDLRPEYDLRALEVRRLGPKRKHFGRSVVQLAPDVAEVFPDAESVNEALRSLTRFGSPANRIHVQTIPARIGSPRFA